MFSPAHVERKNFDLTLQCYSSVFIKSLPKESDNNTLSIFHYTRSTF